MPTTANAIESVFIEIDKDQIRKDKNVIIGVSIGHPIAIFICLMITCQEYNENQV